MARSRARSTSSKALAAEFGRRVRAVREGLQPPVSQERLAERAGLHRTYISHLELGKGSPTLDVIVRVAEALEVDPAVLLQELRSEG
jgi:transcriptional regulator with XRE-family HTH domain